MARTSLPTCSSIITMPYRVGGVGCLGVGATLAFALDAPCTLIAQPEMWPLVLPHLAGMTIDTGQPKPVGEWLLAGSAYPPGGSVAERWEAEVAIGVSRKRFILHGPRVWQDGRMTVRPAASAPVGWANAWGGPDILANVVGSGWRPGEQGPVHGPTVEHPDHPWRKPEDSCRPCSPSPVAATDPRRLAMMGEINANYASGAFPGYPADFDHRFFQMADTDQQIDGPWRGDENFSLTHWHPDHSLIDGVLPGLRAAVHVGGTSGPLSAVAMSLTTIWFVPEAMIGILVFHGATPSNLLDGGDVERVILGFEALDAAPLASDHYDQLWERRTARTSEAAVASLDDRAMLPPGYTVRFESVAKARAQITAARGGAIQVAMPDMDAAIETMRGRITEAGGVDDEAHYARIRASFDAVGARFEAASRQSESEDDLPAGRMRTRMNGIAALTQELRREMPSESRNAAIAALNAMRQASGSAPPPDPVAMVERLEAFRDRLATSRNAGAAPSSPAGTADVDALLRLIAFGSEAASEEKTPNREDLLEGVTRIVDRVPDSPVLPDPNASAMMFDMDGLPREPKFEPLDPARLRAPDEQWAKRAAAERICVGMDFRRHDLSNQELHGVTFQQCDFSEADLRGAYLKDVSFQRCDAKGMRCDGARWEGGMLTLSRLDGVVAPQSLSSVMMSGCDARGSEWSGRSLEMVSINRADWTGSDLSGVTMRQCTFAKTDLTDCSFVDADVLMTCWSESTLVGADWTQLRGLRCSMHLCSMPDRWEGVALDTMTLRNVDLAGRALTGVRLTRVDLSGSDLRGANLGDAELTDCLAARTDWRDSRLDRATLTRVHAANADLRDASLCNASMVACWFPEARLAGADRSGLNALSSVFLPMATA